MVTDTPNHNSCTKLREITEQTSVGKGIRQGDTISPKLFTSCLDDIFELLDCGDKGLNINGERFTHSSTRFIRFADDIIIFTETVDEFLYMIEELYFFNKQEHHKNKNRTQGSHRGHYHGGEQKDKAS